MLTDCYEKGHTPIQGTHPFCAKCGEPLRWTKVPVGGGHEARAWHTVAELDRLWRGVDRLAASDVGGRHGG